MGKPPTRAIEPRRLKVTPELLANVRQRFEQTDEPLATMAADLGCSLETVRNIAKRETWVRYVAPPRDLSPAAKLAARAKALAAEQGAAASLPPPERGRSPTPDLIGGRQVGVDARAEATSEVTPSLTLPLAGGGKREGPPQLADTAEQFHRELQMLLTDVTAERERMKREGYGKHDLREVSGTIASLSAVLRTLQSMRCAVPQAGADHDYDDIPADIDAFREALARRIEAFMESRADDENAFAVDDDAASRA